MLRAGALHFMRQGKLQFRKNIIAISAFDLFWEHSHVIWIAEIKRLASFIPNTRKYCCKTLTAVSWNKPINLSPTNRTVVDLSCTIQTAAYVTTIQNNHIAWSIHANDTCPLAYFSIIPYDIVFHHPKKVLFFSPLMLPLIVKVQRNKKQNSTNTCKDGTQDLPHSLPRLQLSDNCI